MPLSPPFVEALGFAESSFDYKSVPGSGRLTGEGRVLNRALLQHLSCVLLVCKPQEIVHCEVCLQSFLCEGFTIL